MNKEMVDRLSQRLRGYYSLDDFKELNQYEQEEFLDDIKARYLKDYNLYYDEKLKEIFDNLSKKFEHPPFNFERFKYELQTKLYQIKCNDPVLCFDFNWIFDKHKLCLYDKPFPTLHPRERHFKINFDESTMILSFDEIKH